MHYHIPFTSSACNMAYRKSLFLASGGFDGIGHLRSGDDDLLLMKMMPKLRHGAYNPQPAIQVISIDGADLSSHYHTNIRRASKFRHFPWWLKGLAAFIFAYFGLFYVSLFRLLSGKANRGEQAALGIKTAAELVFTLSHLKLIRQLRLSRLYPVQILVFPAQFLFYALRGTLGKYRWK